MNKLHKKGFLFYSSILILGLFIIISMRSIDSNAYESTANATSSTDYSSVNRDTFISVDSNGVLQISRNKHSNEAFIGKENTWTLFIYLTGTNLESQYGYATKDIEEMLNANFNSDNMDNLNIIIQTGGCNNWHTDYISNKKIQRFKVNNNKLSLLEEHDNQSMGDSNTLYNFLDWGITNYPAQHMGVIFWDHGTGISEGVCNDEIYDNDSISVHELEYTFAKLNQQMTCQFEVIGFDTCLSGSLEYANLLAPYAKYMIGSADLEPGEGWYYTDALNFLLNNPDATGAEFGKVICDSYADYLEKLSAQIQKKLTYTIATYDLSKVDNACIETNYLTKYLYDKLTSSDKEYWTLASFRSSRLRYGMDNLDIGSILEYFNTSSLYDYNTTYYRQAMNELVIYNRICSKYAKRQAMGITLYLPSSIINMKQLNTYRNVCFSPYWLKYIEWINTRVMSRTMEHFIECKWEDSPYFFENNFDFLNYDHMNSIGFDINSTTYNVLIANNNYLKNGFPKIWYSNIINSKKKTEDTSVPTVKPNRTTTKTTDYKINKNELNHIDTIYNTVFTYIDNKLICLGQNNNLICDESTGKISSNFDNQWFMLPDGQLLTTYIISSDTEETVYAFPVMIDNEESSIRLQETVDKNGEKKYTLLGVWDQTGHKNSLDKFARGYLPLNKDTQITPIYDIYNSKDNTYETTYGEEYTIKSDFDFLFTNLTPGTYSFAYEINKLDTTTTYTTLHTFTISN